MCLYVESTNFVIDIWKYLALEILNVKHKYFVETGVVVKRRQKNVILTNKQKDTPKVESNEPITNVVSKPLDVMKRADKRDQYLHDVYIANKVRSTLPPAKPLDVDVFDNKPTTCTQRIWLFTHIF